MQWRLWLALLPPLWVAGPASADTSASGAEIWIWAATALALVSAGLVALAMWSLRQLRVGLAALANGDEAPETLPPSLRPIAARLQALRQERAAAEDDRRSAQHAAQTRDREIRSAVESLSAAIARGETPDESPSPVLQPLVSALSTASEKKSVPDEGLTAALRAFAAGDTDAARRKSEGDGQESPLGLLNKGLGGVAETAARLAEIGAGIRSTLNGLSDDAGDLAVRAESQAATLEETVAAMEEISSIVRGNVANAENANTLAANSAEEARATHARLSEAVDTMTAIQESSDRISEIVGVIDGIASKTNLLALNASVEAARAGEAGKGFRVVAAEVHTLAQGARASARDIRDLIATSSDNIKSGVAEVNGVRRALTSVLEAIEQVSATVDSILESNREQSVGVNQIASGLTQLDSITQKNALLADRTAAATKNAVATTEDFSDALAPLLGSRLAHLPQPAKSQAKAPAAPEDLPARTPGKTTEDKHDAEWIKVSTAAASTPTAPHPTERFSSQDDGDWSSF